MACSCTKRKREEYVWTSDPDADGNTTEVVYPNEMQAKAKKIRKGGDYVARPI